jgi:hypothetical protein
MQLVQRRFAQREHGRVGRGVEHALAGGGEALGTLGVKPGSDVRISTRIEGDSDRLGVLGVGLQRNLG